MKAQKGLKLLFDAVLAETKANPAFARRIEDVFAEWTPPKKRAVKPRRAASMVQSRPAGEDVHPTRDLETLGEDGLRQALAAKPALELLALLDAHNLDPAGKMMSETDSATIADFTVAAAKKKLARDKKAFDY